MFNKLYEHVKGTLHDSQFGFRPQRSAIIQMLCFLDQLYKEVDSIAHDEILVFTWISRKRLIQYPTTALLQNCRNQGSEEKCSD